MGMNKLKIHYVYTSFYHYGLHHYVYKIIKHNPGTGCRILKPSHFNLLMLCYVSARVYLLSFSF